MSRQPNLVCPVCGGKEFQQKVEAWDLIHVELGDNGKVIEDRYSTESYENEDAFTECSNCEAQVFISPNKGVILLTDLFKE